MLEKKLLLSLTSTTSKDIEKPDAKYKITWMNLLRMVPILCLLKYQKIGILASTKIEYSLNSVLTAILWYIHSLATYNTISILYIYWIALL